MAHVVEKKQFLFILIPFYWFNQKQLFLQIQIFLSFASFKHGRKNKLTEYFSACFCDNNFYVYKEKFSMNISKNASKQQKGIF